MFGPLCLGWLADGSVLTMDSRTPGTVCTYAWPKDKVPDFERAPQWDRRQLFGWWHLVGGVMNSTTNEFVSTEYCVPLETEVWSDESIVHHACHD